MKCPFCGHENDDKATKCGHCSAEIPVKETKKNRKMKGVENEHGT